MNTRIERGRPNGRPRFSVRAGALLAAAALAVGAVGCGGDDDETTATTATISAEKETFIKEADQICTDTGDEVNKAVEKRLGKGLQSDDEIIQVYEQITIPALEDMFAEIGDLTPPPGDEDQVQEILDAADEALAASNDNPADLARLPGQDNPFDTVNGLEQDFGFQVCGAIAETTS